MSIIDNVKIKYPDAPSWAFGDSPELANELAELVSKGIKTASCGSLASLQSEEQPPLIGGYNIILDGQGNPVCVIRLIAQRLVRFCDITEELAWKEGEGDRSLRYWRQVHQEFFQREGCFSETMELVAEEFELIEVL